MTHIKIQSFVFVETVHKVVLLVMELLTAQNAFQVISCRVVLAYLINVTMWKSFHRIQLVDHAQQIVHPAIYLLVYSVKVAHF